MARFAIVVADAKKVHAFETRSLASAAINAGMAPESALAFAETRRPVRSKGFVHAEEDTDCPNGGKNCRNCGDPAHAEACASKGHCPDCGTKHGIAPDSVVKAHGFTLKAL